MAQTLDTTLAQLKAAAQQQSASHAASRQQLYDNFVDAYLWWRDAGQQKGYLDKAFKNAGIQTRKRAGNAPNFYALIRLVWDIDTSKRASAVSNWARSMEGLHNEFTSNPDLYANNARSELLNFIHQNSGLGALRGEREMTEQELEDEEATGITEKRGRPKADAPSAATVQEHKKQKAKQAPAMASVANFTSAVTDKDGLLVMVGRRNAQGDIEIVGTDYTEDAVANALRYCTQVDRSAVSDSLRLIAEALEPHALPAKLEKQRKRFFEDTEEKRKDIAGKSSKVKRTTTLRIRPDHNDILVAKSPAEVGAVSYVTPKFQFKAQAEVTLNGKDRQWIEKELLGLEKLPLYIATPTSGLDVDTTSRAADYMLQLTDGATGHNRNLSFYDVAKLKSPNTVSQPVIADRDSLQFDWELGVTPQWLAELDATCITPWINKIGGQHNKPENQWIGFDLANDKMKLMAWWDAQAQKFQQTYEIPFANAPTITGDHGTFACRPKDVVPLLSTLPHLPITSTIVVIRANKHVMEISYATDTADYVHYVPSANETGEQDSTLFTQYGFVAAEADDQ